MVCAGGIKGILVKTEAAYSALSSELSELSSLNIPLRFCTGFTDGTGVAGTAKDPTNDACPDSDCCIIVGFGGNWDGGGC